MSHRLQLLVPEELDRRIRKAAQRAGLSKGAWVRRAIEAALADANSPDASSDPLARLEALGAPTGSVEDLLGEIAAARK